MKAVKSFRVVKWVLVAFLISVIISCVALIDYLQLLIGINQSELELNGGQVIYSIQHEGNPMNVNLEDFQQLYQFLTSSDRYQYFELYTQYIEMPNQESEFYEYGTNQLSDHCEGVKCVQISKELLERGEVNASAGRLFEAKDFIYQSGETLPVLMGGAYSSLYNIGDTFEAEYLFDKYIFEIIGFLSEDSNIGLSSHNIDLAKYIVMPSFAIGSEVPVTDGLKVHYANKTSGLICFNKADAKEFHDKVEPVLESAQAGEYTWTVSPVGKQYEEIFKISIRQTQIVIVICIMAMLLLEASLIFNLSKQEGKIKRNVNSSVFLQGIFLTVFSVIIYFFISYALSIIVGIKAIKFYCIVLSGILSFGMLWLKSMFYKYIRR